MCLILEIKYGLIITLLCGLKVILNKVNLLVNLFFKQNFSSPFIIYSQINFVEDGCVLQIFGCRNRLFLYNAG
jgi:uncharacterized integral membrane protein